MTLWRQVAMIIAVLLALVFAGTFIISINSMQRFLITQMNSHAQDTASSLGLSISKSFAANDMVTVSRTIDAIFDRGYYKKITVKDIAGKTLYNNVFQEEIANAPKWFMNIIHIPEQEAQAILLAGWKNAGTLYVTSHPGYAYFELWKICKDNFWWFSLCIAVLLCGSLLALRALLRPLGYVVEQAISIANKNFIIQDRLPFTQEFRVVVETMNKMSATLKEMFAKQVEFSALMRERSYKDMVTGLGNERYFDSQLDQILSSTESSIGGGVFVIRLTEMGKYRSKWGYQLGDILLKDVASILTQLLNKYNIPVLCHFGNYEFAMVVLNIENTVAADIATEILQRINSLEQHEFVKEKVVANIGCVIFTHDSFTKDILVKADNALRHSQEQGTNKIVIEEAEQTKAPVIIDNWEQFLRNVLAEKEVFFNYQPVFFYEDKATLLFHNEILLRLKAPTKEILPSGLFMPIVDELGLGGEFDKLVIELAIEHINDTQDSNQCYGINLTRASLQDPSFIQWLDEHFDQLGTVCSRLNIEVAENLVRDNLEMVKELFANLRSYGIKVGLDHFGRGFTSFSYLNDLPVDYIKVDGSYIRGVEDLTDNQMIIRTFVEMGHGLGIVVIATSVETEAERDMLFRLHVDGMQGYFIGQPA